MKIPPEKIKPFSTEIAPECTRLIAGLKNTGDLKKFAASLDGITEWCSVFGKTEMGRWVNVLNECDALLEAATETDENDSLKIDRDDSMDQPLISVLRFTSLLFENTFSRSVYNSMERLIKLLDSHNIVIVVQTLRLLMVISKNSRFISQHLGSEMRVAIYNRLTAILEIWGGKLRAISFAEFCSESFTPSYSLQHIQIRPEMTIYPISPNKTLAESAAELKSIFNSHPDLQKPEIINAHTKLRFIYSIRRQKERFYQIMARLISTSIIFYSRCLLGDESRLNGLASDHYIGQCCELLHFDGPANMKSLTDSLKTEALKTLASIVFLEKAKKIQLIVDSLELRNYHGFCPALIRQCVDRLKSTRLEPIGECSTTFVTSLFSLVYHIAGFEYGGDALNHSSLVSVLLSVVKTHTLPENYISYVTRSVRIIDILTGTGVTEFNANEGTETTINRFTHEIEQSRAHMKKVQVEGMPFLCNQQRLALMKSLLNFLKRAVLDVNLAAQMRRIMDTDLPSSLKHIIENPQYYGSSLLHCAITLVTNFIYQEPAQLTTLQTKGLTDAVMKLIFNEKFPISRDLICAMPNVCSALCLNDRGLNEIKSYNNQRALARIFGIIFSNKFLMSMRKRKTEILETAHMLGTSFDELIRHQPTLRKEVMGNIATILDTILKQSQNEKTVIAWSVGKSLLEEDGIEHLPIGDFLAMMGVMLETMLTNRGNQENIQVLSESGIPIRLVKLLSQATKPNPTFLNSNYLPNLANILCCVMRQSNKVDEAFTHLVGATTNELDAYSSIKDTCQERLCQITRLSSLVSTMNNLMKSVIHAQNSYDIRPFLLHYFATDTTAKRFVIALFDTYKLMSSDKLLSAAQQTTTQILEDTTKVQELLRINDGDASMETDYGSMPSDRYSTNDANTLSDLRSEASLFPLRYTSDHTQQQAEASTSNDTMVGTSKSVSNEMTGGSTSASLNNDATERSIQHVAYRCQRQISELIVCIGKNFCNANVTRVRQRAAQNLQINQETLKKGHRQVSKLVFSGMYQLLYSTEQEKENTPASLITQSLNLLKKVLIDDLQSIQQLLPDFYLTGCHRTFFGIAKACFQPNLAKEEYIATMNTWLNISQKLISSSLLTDTSKQARSTPQRVQIDGFEIKHYIATAQKDTFITICAILKSLIEQCKDPRITQKEETYTLLEKLLEYLKVLLKDSMRLLDLTETKEDVAPEVPVNAIDPNKIQQLVEMGFSQSDALDALLQFTSVPEAAEYLVSMMERNTARQPSPTPQPAALASIPEAHEVTSNAVTEDKAVGSGDSQNPTSSVASDDKSFAELKPLNREELQERVKLCQEIVINCVRLISRSRSVIIGLSELIAVFGDDPLARSWVIDDFLQNLITGLDTQAGLMMETGNAAEEFAAKLHLFNLIWQAFPNQNIHKLINGAESDENFTMGLE